MTKANIFALGVLGTRLGVGVQSENSTDRLAGERDAPRVPGWRGSLRVQALRPGTCTRSRQSYWTGYGLPSTPSCLFLGRERRAGCRKQAAAGILHQGRSHPTLAIGKVHRGVNRLPSCHELMSGCLLSHLECLPCAFQMPSFLLMKKEEWTD